MFVSESNEYMDTGEVEEKVSSATVDEPYVAVATGSGNLNSLLIRAVLAVLSLSLLCCKHLFAARQEMWS